MTSTPTGPALSAADGVLSGQAVPAMCPSSSLTGAELEAAIGRLVREALGPHRAAPIPNSPAHPATLPAAVASERIAAAVISLRTLEGLGKSVKRLEIAPRAVVTPAAADLLRERGIEFVRGAAVPAVSTNSQAIGASHSSAGAAATAACGWIADADHPERTAAYVRQLAGRGLSAVGVALPTSSAAVPPGIGVVVAELPALQIDSFARRLSIPAAAVTAVSDVRRIAAAFLPQVWVLDAERLSFSARVAVAAECLRLSQARGCNGNAAAERRRPR